MAQKIVEGIDQGWLRARVRPLLAERIAELMHSSLTTFGTEILTFPALGFAYSPRDNSLILSVHMLSRSQHRANHHQLGT